METEKKEPLSPAPAGKWCPEVVARKIGLDVDQAEAVVRACALHDCLLTACKGALAALSQNKTHPADIAAARTWLGEALTEIKEETT